MTQARCFVLTLLALVMAIGSSGCASETPRQTDIRPDWTYQPGPVTSEPVMDFNAVIQPGDRIVFIGDEMTQQMFYTRAVATALLSLMPDADLRLYNAGRDGATAATTAQNLDRLFELTEPTVVFIALGLNDALPNPGSNTPPGEAFQTNLTALVKKVREQKTVRQVILVGPPAVQSGLTAELAPDSYNAALIRHSEVARQVAADTNAGYIDLFIHTSAVYLGQMQIGGDPLTLGGRLPSEEGHILIASVILRGIGVTGEELDRIGFCPLLPGNMGRIRPALALETHAPQPDLANASRAIYLTMARYDEAFFKEWRLAGRNRLSWTPQEAAAKVALAWGNVLTEVQQLDQLRTAPAAREK